MADILKELDELAGIRNEGLAGWLERAAFVFLTLMTLAAPHSIAATQTAWLLGMVCWIARFFIRPRPSFVRTALFLPFAAFLAWSCVTAVFSYAPDISIDKLRNVSLLLIFFYAVNNLRTKRAVRLLAAALVFSCMVNVVWTVGERLAGRGVEVSGLGAESVLKKAEMRDGDTIVSVNGREVSTPDEVIAALESRETSEISFYRPDYYVTEEIRRTDLPAAGNALERLGAGGWRTSRNWRSTGFYSHYATYAEVLQLIASLAFGLLVACVFRRAGRGRKEPSDGKSEEFADGDVRAPGVLLFISVGLMAVALLLTVTRASQAAFLVSGFAVLLVGAPRKLLLAAILAAVPVVIGGLVFLQQSREVGFLDTSDNSTTWRQTVYREGFELWTDNPRHFLLGVGLDSIKRYKDEWGLFDNGRLPPGHMHSTPLQLVVERGLPALLLWLWIVGVYAFQLLRALRRGLYEGWVERGVLLGALGGLVGFFVSGLVHYNLGDGEVAMVFYLIMALSMRIADPSVRHAFKDH